MNKAASALRLHQIRCLEIFSSIRDKFRVARMIDRFHSGDDVHQLGVMMMNVFDQLCLCIGWSRDENSASVRNRLSDRVEIVMIFRGVSTPDGVRLVMDVLGRVVRVQDKSFNIRWAEMEHTRFVVINPNDGMEVMLAHGTSPVLAICEDGEEPQRGGGSRCWLTRLVSVAKCRIAGKNRGFCTYLVVDFR